MAKEFDLVVIGSGPAGYVAAIKAAQLGLKTACIEKYPALGGTCLNVGCIPSKALLQSSEFYAKILHDASLHGIETQGVSIDFAKMMQRKESILQNFRKGIEGLFKKNGVERLQGVGSFIDPNQLQVVGEKGKEIIKSSSFIIATGSKPTELPFLPFDDEKIVSSSGILSLKKPPKKLIVIGAGIIGVELGSVYKRLGSEVVFLEFLDRICPTLDEDVSKAFQKILEKQGLQFLLGAKVVSGSKKDQEVFIEAEIAGKKESFAADCILVAIGRKPYTSGLGLENIGINVDKRGYILVDGQFRTSHPHILAIGDVIDGPMLAHKGEEEGVAAAEILAGHHPQVEYITIPSVVYTHPEVACVGLTEKEVKDKGIPYSAKQFPFKANSRAQCMGEVDGFVKMIAHQATGQILGIHILGAHAGDLIAEGVLAMQQKLKAQEIATLFHAHPTLCEAIKEAACMISSKAIHI